MPPMPGFVGGSYAGRSIQWDGERTINLYVEGHDAGTPKSAARMLGTPSLQPFVGVGAGPVRQVFSQDGRNFAVSGTYFAEFYQSQTAEARGIVQADSRPATIVSNGQAGQQLFIVSGGLGYIFDLSLNSFVQITDHNFPSYCVQGEFFDQYFFALDRDTGEAFFSDLDDGLTWSGIDFFAESQFSDTVRSFKRVRDNLWLFGTKNTGPWYDAGGANNPFVPVPGSVMAQGIIGEGWSAVGLDNSVMWLARNELGQGQIMRANGYNPERVSTHALEFYLNSASSLDASIGFAYQEEGHLFYCLYVPTLPTTPVFDVASGLWEERAHWNSTTMVWEPWRPRCSAFGCGKLLFGDRASGTIYYGDLNQYVDRLVG